MIQETLAIGEVAARAGVSTSAIRYYESAGVLPAPERDGGRRRYDPRAVDVLLLVRFCQRIGFSLAEVRELLAGPAGGVGKRRWRRLVDHKLHEVDAAIERLQAGRELLLASRECDCVSLDECGFLREEAASAGGGEDLVAPRRGMVGRSRPGAA